MDRKLNRAHELAHQLKSFEDSEFSDGFDSMTVDLIHYVTSQDPEPSLSAKFQACIPVWCLEKRSLSCAAREFRRLVSDLEKHAAKSHKTPSDGGRETRMEASVSSRRFLAENADGVSTW